jgi:hypothetical protein
MRRTWWAVGAVVALALAGCSGSAKNASSGQRAPQGVKEEPVKGDEQGQGASAVGLGSGPAAVGAGVPLSRSIVRTADVDVRVAEPDVARHDAIVLVVRAGGYLEAEQGTFASGTTLTLRVPPESFDATVDAVSKLGTVTSRTVSTDDVTGDVADVSGRLAAARASAARLRGLLDRAGSVTEITTLESELSERESDLESLASRQRALHDRTSLATVTATFTRAAPKPPPPPKVAAPGFTGGLRAGWTAFVGTVRVLLVVVGALLPFLVVSAVMGAAVLAAYRRRRRIGVHATEL